MLSLDKYNSHHSCCGNAPSKSQEDQFCAVCLDAEQPTNIVIFGCMHRFHADCILNWVEKNFTCPLCRQECQSFVPTDGQTLDPRFTELWEAHFLRDSPETKPEPKPVKKTVEEKKPEELVSTKEKEPVPRVAPSLPLLEEYTAAPTLRQFIPVKLPDIYTFREPAWKASLRLTQSFVYNNSPHFAPIVRSMFIAMVVLDLAPRLPQRDLRMKPFNSSANNIKRAKMSILDGHISRVSARSMRYAKIQPFVTSSLPVIFSPLPNRIPSKSRLLYKAEALRPFVQFTPPSRKVTTRLSILRQVL